MDPQIPPQAPQVGTQGTNAPDGASDGPEPKQYSAEYVRELRAEAAKHRKRAQELEAAQQTAEQARAAQDAAALAEQGKFKELYEAAQKQAQEATAAQKAAERRALVAQLAQEAGLPAALIARVQGDDEAAIKADIATLLPLVAPPLTGGTPTRPAQTPTALGSFTTTQLSDHRFYLAHKEEIMKAAAEGRIIDG